MKQIQPHSSKNNPFIFAVWSRVQGSSFFLEKGVVLGVVDMFVVYWLCIAITTQMIYVRNLLDHYTMQIHPFLVYRVCRSKTVTAIAVSVGSYTGYCSAD